MIGIADFGLDHASPALGQRRGEQDVILADAQRLVVAQRVLSQELPLEDRLHVAERERPVEHQIGGDEIGKPDLGEAFELRRR